MTLKEKQKSKLNATQIDHLNDQDNRQEARKQSSCSYFQLEVTTIDENFFCQPYCHFVHKSSEVKNRLK